MIEKLQNFVFKGMLLDAGIEVLEEIGITTKESAFFKDLDKDRAGEVSISLEDFSSKIRLNAIKMSSVYIAFFCFENSVRDLITERLKERVSTNWWNKCVQGKIKANVKKRKGTDSKNKWHAPRASENIAYTDFGDMANIICHNWNHFEDLFPSQEWVKTRSSDLEQSRNAIAHNNVLEKRDIDRIKMYLED